jgi:hypothetical protein
MVDLTLEEAVDVLNRHEHNGTSHWHIRRFHSGPLVCGEIHLDNEFSEFEAIAIAQAYLRTPAAMSPPADGEVCHIH